MNVVFRGCVCLDNKYSSTSTTRWCYLHFLTSTHDFCQQGLNFLMYIPQRTAPHQSWLCDNEWFDPWPLSLLGCLHVCLTNFLYECNLIFHYQAVTWRLLPDLDNLQHQNDSKPTEPNTSNNSHAISVTISMHLNHMPSISVYMLHKPSLQSYQTSLPLCVKQGESVWITMQHFRQFHMTHEIGLNLNMGSNARWDTLPPLQQPRIGFRHQNGYPVMILQSIPY